MSPQRSTASNPRPKSKYYCTCDRGEGSGSYIQCDNDDCPVGWYHWECVQVDEEPDVGMLWLCPDCSPNMAFYRKQLVQRGGTSSPLQVPRLSGRRSANDNDAASFKVKKLEKKFQGHKGIARKGTAVKKPVPEKPKSRRWLGWVEMSPDGVKEFKKRVNAQWDADDVVTRKRRKTFKVVAREDEKRLCEVKIRSGAQEKQQEEQQQEEEDREGEPKELIQRRTEEEEDEQGDDNDDEGEQAPIGMRSSMMDISSEDSEDPHDMMEEGGSALINEDISSDEPSGFASDARGGRHGSPSLSNPHYRTPYPDEQDMVSELDAEEVEHSMDIEHQEESIKADFIDISNGSESMGDDDDSASFQTAVESLETVTITATTGANDSVGLYQRQGECWGDYPESAIRSTLAHLC